MSFSISTSDRTSLASSSNLRKAAKASKQITTERILYKEDIESALQATNCSTDCSKLRDCDRLLLGSVMGQQTLRTGKNTLHEGMLSRRRLATQLVKSGNAMNC